MNTLETKMVTLLREMAKRYDVIALKAEFEAEATRIDELKRLKDIAHVSGLGIIIKIGGAEAITDMFEARLIGATTIVAPMIESEFALSKYLAAIEKYFSADERTDTHFGVNIETHLAYTNLPAMLSLPDIHIIDTLTLGRVDMSGSMGLTRKQISSPKMNRIGEKIFRLAKEKKLITTLGGGIDENSIPFITDMAKKGLMDRFETRKVVFKTGMSALFMAEGIIKANEFELLWLLNKKQYYSQIIGEDEKRIEMLKSRV
jgi:4-hydroxy-2-oxoheptanedioate aldolase